MTEDDTHSSDEEQGDSPSMEEEGNDGDCPITREVNGEDAPSDEGTNSASSSKPTNNSGETGIRTPLGEPTKPGAWNSSTSTSNCLSLNIGGDSAMSLGEKKRDRKYRRIQTVCSVQGPTTKKSIERPGLRRPESPPTTAAFMIGRDPRRSSFERDVIVPSLALLVEDEELITEDGEEEKSSSDVSRSSSVIFRGLPTADAVNEEEEHQQILRDAMEHGRRSVLLNAVNAEVVAPQIFTKETLQMPTFPPELEARFQLEHNHLINSFALYFAPLGLLESFVFLALDSLHSINLVDVLIMKLIVFTIALFFVFLAQRFPGSAQNLLHLGCQTMSIYISIHFFMFWQDGFVIGTAFYPIIIFAASLLQRFRNSIVFFIGTLLHINVLAVTADNRVSYTLTFTLAHVNSFVITYSSLALLISYALELHLRHRFQQSGTIFGWTRDSGNFRDNMSETSSRTIGV